jgi:uracil-DNA glycosylase family 4
MFEELKKELVILHNKRKQCKSCELSGNTFVTFSAEYNEGPCDILFIGINPGKCEAESGVPFTGRSGQLLRKMILEAGLSEYNLTFTNSMLCSTKNQSVIMDSKTAVTNCSSLVDLIITKIDPKIIITLGTVPTKFLFYIHTPLLFNCGKLYHISEISKPRLKGKPLITLAHPSALRFKGNKHLIEKCREGLNIAKSLLSV